MGFNPIVTGPRNVIVFIVPPANREQEKPVESGANVVATDRSGSAACSTSICSTGVIFGSSRSALMLMLFINVDRKPFS